MDTLEKYSPGRRHRPGQWGKWKGVECGWDGCDKPAKVRGYCNSHYNKWRWSTGYRAPSAQADSKSRFAGKLKYRYGITIDDYERMLAEQGGGCAICERHPAEAGNPEHWTDVLCVDHCHDTGKVRGLLCNDCNLAIGRGKSAETLERMASYVRLHARHG